jgi:hypothetical protein
MVFNEEFRVFIAWLGFYMLRLGPLECLCLILECDLQWLGD